MLIANPIYDTVFKHMMDDQKVAKIFLSALLDQEVLSLEMRPTERRAPRDDGATGVTVFQMDFNAKVKYKNGVQKLVLIEIQKAKFHTDIMRFRKYLGSQYSNPENATPRQGGLPALKALPIHSIYFLGHKLDNIAGPVIRVSRVYKDSQNKIIEGRDEFIESLTHDSVIVQIPYLKPRRRNDIEALLSVFSQDNAAGLNKQMLDIDETLYPEKYRPVIRRLMKAAVAPAVREEMDIEDDFLASMESFERCIAEERKIISEQGKLIEENKKTLEENKKTLEEKDRLIEELKKRLGGGKTGR
jgi:hypothetical protein